MKVQFNGPEDECTVFGANFPKGVAVEIDSLPEDAQSRLAKNPTFGKVDGRRRAVVAAE